MDHQSGRPGRHQGLQEEWRAAVYPSTLGDCSDNAVRTCCVGTMCHVPYAMMNELKGDDAELVTNKQKCVGQEEPSSMGLFNW